MKGAAHANAQPLPHSRAKTALYGYAISVFKRWRSVHGALRRSRPWAVAQPRSNHGRTGISEAEL
jgi:hypothetical protein